MYILLSIWPIASYPLYVIGGLISGTKRAISGNAERNLAFLTERASSTPATATVHTKTYNVLSKLIGCFGSQGRANIRNAEIVKSLKDKSVPLIERFTGVVGKLKPSGNAMLVFGVLAGIGLLGYGVSGALSEIKEYDHSCHEDGAHQLVTSKTYHGILAGLGGLMALSVGLIPFIGPGMLAVGGLAGVSAMVLHSRLVQRHLAGMGIFNRPSDYIPGDPGMSLHRWVNPKYLG